MAKEKQMNPMSFSKLVKELNAAGENIRTRQDQKQVVLNNFENERQRFVHGRISKDALASSSKKTNAELHRLNKEIRKSQARSSSLLRQLQRTISHQAPRAIRVSTHGAKGGGHKKKKHRHIAKKLVVPLIKHRHKKHKTSHIKHRVHHRKHRTHQKKPAPNKSLMEKTAGEKK